MKSSRKDFHCCIIDLLRLDAERFPHFVARLLYRFCLFQVTAQGQDMTIDYVGTVDGDTMAGTVVFGDLGEGTFEGTRKRPQQE